MILARFAAGNPLTAIFRWGPVLLWMAGITYFSSLSDPLGPLSRYSDLIGQIGHIAEYAGLAVLLHRATHHPSRTTHHAFALSFAIGLLFALLDELHQAFVPGREAALGDVGLDTVGLGVGLLAVWLLGCVVGSLKRRSQFVVMR
jgi:VanZ family protein